jgi:hypothetical protein
MKSTNICSNRNLVASVGFQCEGLVTGDIDLGRLKNRAARGTRVSFWSNLLWLCADHWLLINIILYIYISWEDCGMGYNRTTCKFTTFYNYFWWSCRCHIV